MNLVIYHIILDKRSLQQGNHRCPTPRSTQKPTKTKHSFRIRQNQPIDNNIIEIQINPNNILYNFLN